MSPNAPSKSEILGTILLSVLSGNLRYAHITGMRGGDLFPPLLGTGKLHSEDSVWRVESSAGWLGIGGIGDWQGLGDWGIGTA